MKSCQPFRLTRRIIRNRVVMDNSISDEQIRERAKALDGAIEKHDVEQIMSYFSRDCEIQLPDVTLTGHEGLRKAVRWMFRYLRDITLTPVTIMVQDSVFFEEYVVRATVGGRRIEVRQAEVLVFGSDGKVTSIRLYFDRLELGQAFASNVVDRFLAERVSSASLRGLR
jgi:ketosteroid isomerase-like protein